MIRLWEAAVRGRRGLRLLLGHAAANASPPPALFFHHIAKTGGTSFIRTMRTMVPPELQASENGDVSVWFVERLIAAGLKPGQFIYGHPGPGAAAPLRDRACMAVMLRQPREQAISNYLWVQQDWRLPDHAAASALDFRGFLAARPYFAIFQAASLHVGLNIRPLDRLPALVDALPALTDYLGQFQLVGVTEQAPDFYAEACRILGLPHPPKLPHHRKSRIPQQDRQQMREQYEGLRTDPELGPLIAAEEALFLACQRIRHREPVAD